MEEQKNPNFENMQDHSAEGEQSAPERMPLAWNGELPPFESVKKEEAPDSAPKAEEAKAEEGEPEEKKEALKAEGAEEMAEEPAEAASNPQGGAQVPPFGGQPPYGQPPYRQGGYSYQNPNPYQNYQWQPAAQPPKKDRNRPFMIAAVIAAVIIALCCLLVVAVQFKSFNQWLDAQKQEGIVDTPIFGEGEKEKEEAETGSAQRQEGAVYNAPQISTEKKQGEVLSLIDINKKVKDSVVGILIAEKNQDDPKFSGSGFIISEDGYIITNEHVVNEAAQVKVVLSDGITEYQAVIVGKDAQSDLAILKVEAKGLVAAELGDSDELEVGETVVAIGNPYGMVLAGSMTDGIVSALNRKIEINGSFMTLIQTNASINPGNSGGPLVNAYGQVVGICSSKLVATDYEGIGFAIPINDVVNLSEDLINHGYIRTRAYIGIMGSDLEEDYCKYHKVPQGVYVSYVDPECDAAKKGMKEGDIIIGFNEKELSSMARLNELKNEFRPGDTVKVKVWRDQKELEFEIKLTESSD